MCNTPHLWLHVINCDYKAKDNCSINLDQLMVHGIHDNYK